MKEPVEWVRVGPGEGPVTRVWGLEGRREREPAGCPHTQPFLSLFSALSWDWVKCSVLREEEEGESSGEKKTSILAEGKGHLGIHHLHLAQKTENSLLWGKEKM